MFWLVASGSPPSKQESAIDVVSHWARFGLQALPESTGGGQAAHEHCH